MRTYTCSCGPLAFFQNVTCVACGRELGFLPDVLRLSSLEEAGEGLFKANRVENRLYKKCQNYAKESVCNWMIPADGRPGQKSDPFCVSCRLNRTIPDLNRKQNHDLWACMELSKRRLIYSVLNLNLPVANKTDDPTRGLAFAFLEDAVQPDGRVSKILTGHENGLVTLNIDEADDAVREKIRVSMGEPLRTLLGHFRHEIGHYYWDRLIRDTKHLDGFRDLFGDEQINYQDALNRYYSSGAPLNWQDNYISAYATAHPWEDWAESWAHFMHIQDTLETANEFGLVGKSICLYPNEFARGSSRSSAQKAFKKIIRAWTDLTIALSAVNRSMGLHDTYPFIISTAAANKLSFISEIVSGETAASVAAA
jgi:hypothetical protein